MTDFIIDPTTGNDTDERCYLIALKQQQAADKALSKLLEAGDSCDNTAEEINAIAALMNEGFRENADEQDGKTVPMLDGESEFFANDNGYSMMIDGSIQNSVYENIAFYKATRAEAKRATQYRAWHGITEYVQTDNRGRINGIQAQPRAAAKKAKAAARAEQRAANAAKRAAHIARTQAVTL